MEEHPYLPVPPGLVDDVARRCHETMCETAEVTVSDGRGTAWETLGPDVRDTWRAVARQAVAATLNRMIHEGWLVVRPANIQEKKP
jgi:hypothetical protein